MEQSERTGLNIDKKKLVCCVPTNKIYLANY